MKGKTKEGGGADLIFFDNEAEVEVQRKGRYQVEEASCCRQYGEREVPAGDGWNLVIPRIKRHASREQSSVRNQASELVSSDTFSLTIPAESRARCVQALSLQIDVFDS